MFNKADLRRKFLTYRIGGLVGTLLVFGIGLFFLVVPTRISQWLTHASHDWSFGLSSFAQPDVSGSDVVIVYMDEDSYKDLQQPSNAPWDRALHARLLDRLTADGAKAVVMDIMFDNPGSSEEADRLFTQAIAANGRVILGADYNGKIEGLNHDPTDENAQTSPGMVFIERLSLPDAPLGHAAAGVGLVKLLPDADFLIRKHFHGFTDTNVPASLSWVTAKMLNLPLTKDPAEQWSERWVNYYGPAGTIPHVSYEKVLLPGGVAPGFFKDKVVFVGARPMVGAYREKRDEMRSPYSIKGEFTFMPMVEIHATQLLNLIRGDWLSRPAPVGEISLMGLSALVFGYGLLRFRPWIAAGLAVVGGLATLLLVQSIYATQHVWFAWMIIVAAQIPAALVYSFVFRSLEWYVQRRKFEAERREADIRIREQAALLDKAQDAIVVHDLNWQALYWNQSAERLYGWKFDELKGRNLKTDVFKAEESKLLEALQQALAKGEWTGELKQATKADKPIIVQSRWTLVRDDAGAPRSILVINTDVTEQKKLEAQFLRTQRMESIGTLAGGIAHDLNNVLAPILMAGELMKMKASDEFSQKMLTTILSGAKRGSDMVKQVLSFARGHEGERTVLQISHLIREMQKIVRETFPKNINFKTEVEDISPILGDATQIHQILLNLCVNARDAMPEGGDISIKAKNVVLSEEMTKAFAGAKPGNYVLLSVADTGSGIPPEIIDKIFEPFFTTKEIGKGTGLGLSTVISIIKSHEGFLDLKSEVGKGTSFNVYLPAASVLAPQTSDTVSQESLWGMGQTVMVIDDEPAILELTKATLVQNGYRVVTALHGADALALYSEYKKEIKVVIVDMMMPVMDGTATVRALKREEPNLRFIAVSGLVQEDKIREQLSDPKIAFLAKPFGTTKLLEIVRDALAEDRRVVESDVVVMAK